MPSPTALIRRDLTKVYIILYDLLADRISTALTGFIIEGISEHRGIWKLHHTAVIPYKTKRVG